MVTNRGRGALSASRDAGPDADAASGRLLIRRTGRPGLGALVLAIASIWLAAAIRGVLAGNPAIVPGLGNSGAYWAGAIGAALAVLSLHWIVRRQTVAIDRDALFVTERSLLGRHTWRELLSNYREIRASEEQRPHRYGVRRWYVVQLWHPEPAKRIELACARVPAAIEAPARDYARRLGLPLRLRHHDLTAMARAEGRDEIMVAEPEHSLSRVDRRHCLELIAAPRDVAEQPGRLEDFGATGPPATRSA